MNKYKARLQDSSGNYPVYRDDVEVTRTITGLTVAQDITKAWLTVKSDLSLTDANAELQLEITTVETAAGQITDDATGDTEGALRFDISGATDYTNLVANVLYHFDIQILLSDGKLATIEKGRTRWEAEVTQATS